MSAQTASAVTKSEFPRHYVKADAVFDAWEAVQPAYAELARREIADATALEQWLIDWSELES